MAERVSGAKDSEDAVVVAWWLMYDAVRTAFDGDVRAGAGIAGRAVEQACTIGPANEDVPFAYSLAVDMLLEAGDLATLERITAPLLELPMGQRFRLLQGQLLRAGAHCSAEPVSMNIPAYITFTRSAMPATTPRSWVIQMIAMWNSF